MGDVGRHGGEGQRDTRPAGMRWRGRKTRTPPQHTPARPHVRNILNWELPLVSGCTSVCPRRWLRESQGALFWVCYCWGRRPTSVGCLSFFQQDPPGPSFAADGLSRADNCPPLPESNPASLEPGARGPGPRVPVRTLPSGGSGSPGTVGGLLGHEGHCGE